jgi:hypothetical protein
MIEFTQSSVFRQEDIKAAWQNGHRRPAKHHDGWFGFEAASANSSYLGCWPWA